MDQTKQGYAFQYRADGASEQMPERTAGRSLRHSIVVLVGLLALWLATPNGLLAQAGDTAIGPVFALRGTLVEAENQPYATFLVLPNGTQIGLVGQTPLVESDIVQLRVAGPDPIVKVWGLRYAAQSEGDYDLIVVEEIQAADALPQPTTAPTTAPTTEPVVTATPTATPQPTSVVPLAIVEAANVNVRSGPSTDYPPVGNLVAGQSCPINGRNAEATWWRLSCTSGLSGWVFGQLLAITGGLDQVPVIQPAPPPTPAPTQTFSGWRAEYFDNRNLTGTPVLVQDVPSINFNWGNGSPGAAVPADNFSARFERTLNFSYGNYVIQTTADDGMRVYIDDQLFVNDWNTGAARDQTIRRILSGNHTFRIEYFEATGAAQLRFTTKLLSSEQAWRASYYDNPNLTGSPVAVRGEPRGGQYPIDFTWGLGSPVLNSVPVNSWSGRWEGDFYFEGGDYRFTANVDDGIRVYLDGIRLIDLWQNGFHNGVSANFAQLGQGNHRVTIEYYDNTDGAYLRLWWDRTGDLNDDERGRDE